MIARERREGGEAAGRGGNRAAARARGEAAGGRRKEGGEGRLTGGPRLSAPRGKRKRREGEGGLARELGWAAWAEREPVRVFFPFSNFIFKSFFISNSIQTFSNFSQKFCELFRNHTSNQKPCKSTDDAHTLVVSKFIKLSLIF
jgi:hypothetical protein